MARKPSSKAAAAAEFVMFDVLYDDGSRLSNRRVPSSATDEGDDAVRAFLAAQDREIAEISGRPRGDIKSVSRSAKR